MFKNYFKTAWRNLKRNKAFSFINIFGLAIGMAACLLILQYVSFELSYEDFQVQKNQIYRVQQDRYDNGKLSTQWAAGAFSIGNYAKEEIPEVKDYVKVISTGNQITYVDNQPIKIENAFFSSKSFFEIFTYPLVAGNGKLALEKPFTTAISETMAKRLFGSGSAVGKTLVLNKSENYTVTAVYKDASENTQLRPDILLSYATIVSQRDGGENLEDGWYQDGCLTYLLLNQNTKPQVVESKIKTIVDKYAAPGLKKMNASVVYHLQPLKDIHMYSHYIMEPGPSGDGKTVYLLLAIAIFIVVIAWVNYVNLSTARAVTRAKEVGVRKAIGSQRKQLIIQFLSESALLNFVALLFAVFLVLIAIPGFNAISGQHISFSLFSKYSFWIGLVILFIVGTFFSGLYPAFILSGFNPVEVLKGKPGGSKQNTMLRKSLVAFQFVASLFLLIGTMVVFKQIQFMRKQSLGVNIEQTLVVDRPIVGVDSTFKTKMIAFKEELQRATAIKNITVSTSVPGSAIDMNAGGVKLLTADDNTQQQYRIIETDYNFLNFYGIKLIAGRPFSNEFGADSKSKAVIFSRKGAELLGFNNPDAAINKKIVYWGDTCTIVGVTENYHQSSLRDVYDNMFFRLRPGLNGFLSLKVTSSNANQIIDQTKTLWNQYFPGNTFESFFLDEHFNAQYKADQQFGKVFILFTCLAVFVACLGLFGLASFTTLQRRKEIGIRKVLGASIISILKILYREIAVLLGLAFLIAAPLAWLATTKWLEGYAFRVSMSWFFFIVPFVIIVLIAVLTISYQTITAAKANPTKSLRSE